MKPQQRTAACKQLLRVYNYRLKVAEARLVVQKGKVLATQAEIVEREGMVSMLNHKLAENREYVQQAEGTSMAETRKAGHRHEYWLDYDKQKESFYLDMTYDELAIETTELQRQKKQRDKLSAKIDTVSKLCRKAESTQSRLLQKAADSELSVLFGREPVDV